MDDGELAAIQASSQLRQMVSFDEVTENRNGEENLPLADRLADPCAPRPDDRVRTIEDRQTLAQCISRLPKSQATVIVLHYLQNVPLREVAQLLAVTPSRVLATAPARARSPAAGVGVGHPGGVSDGITEWTESETALDRINMINGIGTGKTVSQNPLKSY